MHCSGRVGPPHSFYASFWKTRTLSHILCIVLEGLNYLTHSMHCSGRVGPPHSFYASFWNSWITSIILYIVLEQLDYLTHSIHRSGTVGLPHSFNVTLQLFCAFGFAYAKSRFSRDTAHIIRHSIREQAWSLVRRFGCVSIVL